ncbi:amphi-Trp domain-containing protein [Streptomyces sp. NPDC057806]|uniref:amphi-Trp domain-containing protein n=1 Tax=Streptomyces sp. NPDC057806 TaxID=3346255 RepID=UPI0036C9166E
MKDLKFEQKNSLSRLEAADQLAALAQALRDGGEAELDLGRGVLSLRIPDELRTEVEFEVGDGEIELEIELKWPMGKPGSVGADTKEEPQAAPAKPAARSARARRTASTTKPRRTAAKGG